MNIEELKRQLHEAKQEDAKLWAVRQRMRREACLADEAWEQALARVRTLEAQIIEAEGAA